MSDPKKPAADPAAKRPADPELLALSRITRTLAALDPAARQRTVAYLAGRYLPTPAPTDARP
jgi:hypothetical protein